MQSTQLRNICIGITAGCVVTICILCVLCSVFVGGVVWWYLNEDTHLEYSTYAEAEADGAMRWIPKFVPQSATDIRVNHYLDQNILFVRFRFDPEDLAAMQETLTPAAPPDENSHYYGPWSRWPEAMHGDGDAVVDRYNLYTCACGIRFGGRSGMHTAYVAIEKDRPVAWFWDPP